jgi:hypothetical protein
MRALMGTILAGGALPCLLRGASRFGDGSGDRRSASLDSRRGAERHFVDAQTQGHALDANERQRSG